MFLPPANEVCEGYVFTGVCLSTRGGVTCVVLCGHACWGACVVLGGVRGAGGVCVVLGGVHGAGGACVVLGGVRGIRRDTVNERAVRILLECILVF